MRLAVRDATVGYDRDHPVQKDINLTLKEGEVCCILGPNGSGKSTLVNTILGVTPLLGGSITLDGSDVTRWKASRLAETIAFCAQNTHQSFPYDVHDLVMLGRTHHIGSSGKPGPEDYRVVENAMEEMGIRHL
ncbi:MAG: ABC transporter ATP-binding protein, partial [Eggerthellaceae bacterium]|nr:ABC transporter ATP-binding protein [Eggerthellaceae bacterium]